MELIYIPLGLDCSLAYQLDMMKLRNFALPFDWIYTKNLSDIIKLITNNFSNFLPESNDIDALTKLYDIIPIKTNNFPINRPHLNNLHNLIQSSDLAFDPVCYSHNACSKYKLKHKLYNIILQHEFAEINPETIQFFIDKYKRRIKRFYDLNKTNNKLVFIRLGLDCEKNDLFQKLCMTLDNIFSKTQNKIKLLNSTELSKQYKTSDWTRSEYDWNNLFNYNKNCIF
jgi:hypothetical protein